MVVYLLIALLIYAVVGIGFSLYFVTRGVARVDPTAHGAPVGFRILIFPGSAALWPVLLAKTLRGPHASAAQQGGDA